MLTEIVVTRTPTKDGDYAFAHSRNQALLEVVARGLEAEGFTIAIKPKAMPDGTLYLLSATRSTTVIIQ